MQIWIKDGRISKYIIIGKYKAYLCTIEGIFNINNAKEIIKSEGYKNILLHKNINILDIFKEKNIYLFVSKDTLEIIKYDKSIDIQVIL